MVTGLFSWLLLLYLIVTLSYSLKLKSVVLLDVVVLASLYTIRVIAGGEAAQVTPSFWLLAFSGFCFLSLALVKRYVETMGYATNENSQVPGRGYTGNDTTMLGSMGIAAGYMAVLTFALFTNASDVVARYSRPELLWFIPPLLLYYFSYMWFKAHRRQLHDDPIIFSLKNPVTLGIGCLCFVLFLVAFWGNRWF